LVNSLLKKHFPNFSDKELLEAIEQVASVKNVAKGEFLMDVGAYIKFMPLVTKGLIKVMREDKEGNEVLLYYLESGKTCAMSVSCCMQLEKSSIRAVAEEDTALILIPVEYVDQWVSKYQQWKHFVLNSYSKRFDELLEAIDVFAFKKMDERLFKYLQKRSKVLGDKAFEITHQEMALELNTSREVVSRLLKKLEQNKQIKVLNNKIQLS
jgi:CRP/FNR family transcriptional regulator, anaerobic regulatory protein